MVMAHPSDLGHGKNIMAHIATVLTRRPGLFLHLPWPLPAPAPGHKTRTLHFPDPGAPAPGHKARTTCNGQGHKNQNYPARPLPACSRTQGQDSLRLLQPLSCYSSQDNKLRKDIQRKKGSFFWTLSKSGVDPPPIILDMPEVTLSRPIWTTAR